MHCPRACAGIRWFVLVAVGSLSAGCLSLVIPEHHASMGSDAGASAGSDDLGTDSTGGNGATAGMDAGEVQRIEAVSRRK